VNPIGKYDYKLPMVTRRQRSRWNLPSSWLQSLLRQRVTLSGRGASTISTSSHGSDARTQYSVRWRVFLLLAVSRSNSNVERPSAPPPRNQSSLKRFIMFRNDDNIVPSCSCRAVETCVRRSRGVELDLACAATSY
jgi:hypothetical protein